MSNIKVVEMNTGLILLGKVSYEKDKETKRDVVVVNKPIQILLGIDKTTGNLNVTFSPVHTTGLYEDKENLKYSLTEVLTVGDADKQLVKLYAERTTGLTLPDSAGGLITP